MTNQNFIIAEADLIKNSLKLRFILTESLRQSALPEERNVLYGVYREELRLRLHSWLQRWKLRKRYSHPGGVLGALRISSDGDDRRGEKSKPKKKIPRAQTKSKKISCRISEKAFNDNTKNKNVRSWMLVFVYSSYHLKFSASGIVILTT